MSQDQMVAAGAFALYKSEHAHRIAEFRKSENSADLIQRDFEHFKGKYLRKFQDFMTSLASEGLSVNQTA